MTRAILPDLPALDSFGAPKINYGESIDPDAEVSADDFNAMAAVATALAMAGKRAWVTVSSTGVLVAYGSVWGNALGLAPACAKTATGVYTVTFAAAYPDVLDGTSRAFLIHSTVAGANTSSRFANSRHSGQVVTVETFSATGSAADSIFTVIVN